MKKTLLIPLVFLSIASHSSPINLEVETAYHDKNAILPFNEIYNDGGRGVSILRYKSNLNTVKASYSDFNLAIGTSNDWVRGGEDYDFYFQHKDWHQVSKLDADQNKFSVGFKEHQLTYEVGKWTVNQNMFFDYTFGNTRYTTEDFASLQNQFGTINELKTLQYQYKESPSIFYQPNQNLYYSYSSNFGVIIGQENHFSREFTESFLAVGYTPSINLNYSFSHSISAKINVESDLYLGARFRNVYSANSPEMSYDNTIGSIFLIYPKTSFSLGYLF